MEKSTRRPKPEPCLDGSVSNELQRKRLRCYYECQIAPNLHETCTTALLSPKPSRSEAADHSFRLWMRNVAVPLWIRNKEAILKSQLKQLRLIPVNFCVVLGRDYHKATQTRGHLVIYTRNYINLIKVHM